MTPLFLITWLGCSVSTQTSVPAPAPAQLLKGAPLIASLPGKTFQNENMTIAFSEGPKASMIWPNMKGDPVIGKIGRLEDDFEIIWDSNAKNTLNREFKLRSTGPCKLLLFHRTQRQFGETEVSYEFTQTEPACIDSSK